MYFEEKNKEMETMSKLFKENFVSNKNSEMKTTGDPKTGGFTIENNAFILYFRMAGSFGWDTRIRIKRNEQLWEQLQHKYSSDEEIISMLKNGDVGVYKEVDNELRKFFFTAADFLKYAHVVVSHGF